MCDLGDASLLTALVFVFFVKLHGISFTDGVMGHPRGGLIVVVERAASLLHAYDGDLGSSDKLSIVSCYQRLRLHEGYMRR